MHARQHASRAIHAAYHSAGSSRGENAPLLHATSELLLVDDDFHPAPSSPAFVFALPVSPSHTLHRIAIPPPPITSSARPYPTHRPVHASLPVFFLEDHPIPLY